MTVRQLYGWTIAIVAAFGVWAFCLFSPPQTWKVFQKPKLPPKPAPSRTGPFEGDGYQDLSEWLRRNLDDPDFERVTWWAWRSLEPESKKARAAIEAQRKRISDAVENGKRDVDEAEKELALATVRWKSEGGETAYAAYRLAERNRDQAKESWEWWRRLSSETAVQITRDLPEYACRIKYRTRNKFGAKELRDETFGVFRGKIKPLAEGDALALKELFPD